jgi:hypothetical protein
MKTMKRTTRNTKLYCIFFVLFLMNLQIALGQANSLLSIELADFRGENKGMYIELSWDLLNPNQEIDFIVERAGADGIFKTLGTANEDNFLDQNPTETVHYYRLLAYDVVGSEMYSQIIAIEYDLNKEMKIVPNPATTFIDVGFYMEGSTAQVVIFDQQGILVQQENVENNQGGMQYFHLDLENYAAGMYLLRVVEGIRATTMKFVVL